MSRPLLPFWLCNLHVECIDAGIQWRGYRYQAQLLNANKTLKLSIQQGNRNMETLGYLAKGNGLAHLGKLEEALHNQHSAALLANEISDIHTEGRCYGA